MGPEGCPETSVNNQQCMLRNIPEEWSSHLHRGGNLKPRIFYFFVLPRVSDRLTGVRSDVEERSVLTVRMLGRK